MSYSHVPDPQSPFVFSGTDEKIAEDKARMSVFRAQHGMSSNPHGPIIGTPESVENQLALLRAFKKTL